MVYLAEKMIFAKTKKAPTFVEAFAVWTGLEPATPCVTGRYSNQLNYQTNDFTLIELGLSQQRNSNLVTTSVKRVQIYTPFLIVQTI